MFDFTKKRQIMGILNVTPDSFSDGGKYNSLEAGIFHGEKLAAEGCDILDIGGQSTRPGYQEISASEELARVLPVVKALKKKIQLPLSIDTYFPEVAEACLAEGVEIVNDISGLDHAGMLSVLQKYPESQLVLMHSRPRKNLPLKEDLGAFYQEKIQLLQENYFDLKRVCLDPGVGFGKTLEENIQLIKDPEAFRYENLPLLYGISRKRTMGALSGETVAEKRDPASVAASLWLLEHGVEIVRVHDVFAMKQANDVFMALKK